MNIAIIILSAGSSTRMGTTKQLLPIGDTTLLGISIENALQSNADKVFCVLGANTEKIQESAPLYNIEVILNNKYKEGLSSSIKKGIKHIEDKGFDAALIMLGDQPKVDSNYLNLLISYFKSNPTKITASEYEDTIGVPAIFPKIYFNQLQQVKGDKGAKDFLNMHKAQVISVKSDKLIDIDTQEDYLNFLKTL
jgi:molybdenum cofactor cytidylyltransferase